MDFKKPLLKGGAVQRLPTGRLAGGSIIMGVRQSLSKAQRRADDHAARGQLVWRKRR
jgi:hypothetical protein